MEPLEIVAMIIGVFTTVCAVASMQCKNMKFVLVFQLASNTLLATQYIVEGNPQVGGVVFLAIVQTVVSFILNRKSIEFPIWLIAVFMVGYAVITIISFTSFFELLPLAAVWLLAIGLTQKRSSVYRILIGTNCLLWLIYDIFCAPSAILTHAVIIIFTVSGIIRLDRAEWKSFFARIFKGKKEEDRGVE